MPQEYQCSNCHMPVAFGNRFCGNCGWQLNWPTQQQKTYEQTTYNPKDRLYLTTIIVENDPNKNTNMLFCDARGHLSNSHLEEFIVKGAKEIIEYYRQQNKYCAVACFEVTEGSSVTFGVEIDYQEGLALEGILSALRNKKIVNEMIPENFQKHISQIFTKAYTAPAYLERISGREIL